MRGIKFRGKRKLNGDWVYGSLIQIGNDWCQIIPCGTEYDDLSIEIKMTRIISDTVGEYTGLKDKNGTEIYEGDIVRYRAPYRTTQTHEGDNIPNGSYTEPMEPGIREKQGEIKFQDGVFYIEEDEQEFGSLLTPMQWNNREWSLDDIKEAISWTRETAGWFDDPEEGDLSYLISECAKVDTPEQLIQYLRGLEIIGNIYEHKHLLAEK